MSKNLPQDLFFTDLVPIPRLKVSPVGWDRPTITYPSSETPFKNFALPLARILGDFIEQCLFASSIKVMFQYANLFLYWRDDLLYKKHVIAMMANLTYSPSVEDDNTLLRDAFDNAC